MFTLAYGKTFIQTRETIMLKFIFYFKNSFEVVIFKFKSNSFTEFIVTKNVIFHPMNVEFCKCFIIVVVQWLNYVSLFGTTRTAARQASLSFTVSQSLLKLMSIESVMPSNHLNLCGFFKL